MLELIFLFIVIPKRMTRLARERNRSGLKWSLAAIGVWLGVEIVVGIVLAFFIVLSSYLLGTPENPEKVSSVAYFPALVAALISGEFMIRHLRAKPVLPHRIDKEPSMKQVVFLIGMLLIVPGICCRPKAQTKQEPSRAATAPSQPPAKYDSNNPSTWPDALDATVATKS